MKKFLSLLLVLVMVASFCACGDKKSGQNTDVDTSVWDLEGTIFPLDKPVSFKILTSGFRCATLEDIVKSKDWQALQAATNVNIEFEFLGAYDAAESGTNLQNRLFTGDYGDAIVSVYLDNLTKADIANMAEAGMVVPITDYMKDEKIMPNFYNGVYKDHQYLLPGMRSTDGEIYGFYGIAESAGYTSNEALIQVNEAWLKAWQAAKGIDHTPKDMEEFEDMLIFFRDSDLNGNGQKDEIPYFIAQQTFSGTASLEASMGMYGIGIKDSAVDMDIMINDDGECYFVYTTDEYKAALEKFSDWYSKDLIWKEIFTGNAETISQVCSNAAANFGVINCCYNIEGFIAMMPPKAEGYTAKYHTHPATRLGIEGQPYGVITDKCENPEILASFLDLFYNFENSLTARYGSIAWKDGSITTNADGLYVFNVPSSPDGRYAVEDEAIYDFIWSISDFTSDNLKKVDAASLYGDVQSVKGYVMYEEAGLWNPTANLWPRCAILGEYADDYSIKYTDVSSAHAEFRAKVITGQLDVDKEWDGFQAKIKALGVDTMRDIVQKSYDAYLGK